MDAHEEASAAATGLGDTLLERLAERIGGRAKAEAVFGAPVQHGEVTFIPVARVRWGLGAGAVRIAGPMGLPPVPAVAVVSAPTRSATPKSATPGPSSGRSVTPTRTPASSSPRHSQSASSSAPSGGSAVSL